MWIWHSHTMMENHLRLTVSCTFDKFWNYSWPQGHHLMKAFGGILLLLVLFYFKNLNAYYFCQLVLIQIYDCVYDVSRIYMKSFWKISNSLCRAMAFLSSAKYSSLNSFITVSVPLLKAALSHFPEICPLHCNAYFSFGKS